MRITIITAHPDDAEIFCAGTILAWCSLGAEITLIIMSDGRRGGKVAHKNLVNERSVEAKKAAAMLGIKLIELGLEDGRLSDVEMPYKLVRTHLNEFMPDLVVTHAPKDYHEDHRKTSRFTSAVVNFNFPVLFMEPMMGVGVLPTHYVDISKFQDQKEKAIMVHKTQDPLRFVASSRLQAQFRAAQQGYDGYAEAFIFEPIYPFADIRNLLPPSINPKAITDRNSR